MSSQEPQPTVAVLGTARSDFVLAAAVALRNAGASVLVFVRQDRESLFAENGFSVRTFSGRISWHSLSLLTALRSAGAQRIVIVVGDEFAHANVTTALNWWRAAGLLGNADTYVSSSTQPAVLECVNTIDQRERLVAFLVALVVVAPAFWHPVVVFVIALVASGLELIARRTREFSQKRLPAPGCRWPVLADDPRLGWRLRPVNITARTSTPGAQPRTIHVTVDANGERATSLPSGTADNRPAVAFYGGSTMFGDSLSDEETIPWQAAALLSDYRVVNRAVPGYSALQMAMRLQDDLAGRPLAAIVALIDGAGSSELPASGHARFPLSERCAVWWAIERAWNRSRLRRLRAQALTVIGERSARARIPLVVALAVGESTALGDVLSGPGVHWGTFDADSSPQSIARSLVQKVRAVLEPAQRP